MSVAQAASALQAAVWPAGAERVDGHITIAGATLEALAKEHGTPLMLLDEHVVKERATALRSAFDDALAAVGGEPAHMYYAGKALLTADIARWMTAAGFGIDVCSPGELQLALAAGVDPAVIGCHGSNKSERELRAAVAAGVGAIVIDSPIEAERVAQIAADAGVTQRVRLRINVGVHASTHAFLATSHEDQKFGVTIEDAPAIAARIRSSGALELLGLHTHIGSQIFDSAGFEEAASRLLDLHAALSADAPLAELNLGGGFGIAYTESDEPRDIREIADALVQFVSERCRELAIPMPRLAFEPGRSIVGPAGVTVYRVGTVKPVALEGGERVYVSVDGGMSDNARHALYGAEYTARIANRDSNAAPRRCRVVGVHCESGDIVVNDVALPGDIAPGDLLAVPATGAYCASLASTYNLTPRLPIIAVADGASRTLVRRESIEDLLVRDVGLAASDASPHQREGHQ